MGCLFASALVRANCPTTLVLRAGCFDRVEGVERVQGAQGTVTFTLEREGSATTLSLPACSADQNDPISHLLVTTKAQDVVAALRSVAHRRDAASTVLLLANGQGFAAQLGAAVPAPDYYFGITTEGAYRTPDGRVHHAGRGLTRVGHPGRTRAPAWFAHWAEAVQPGCWDPDIEQSLWLKLAINCAINPLTAVQRCNNGELASGELALEVARLCSEIMAVSAAAGYAAVTSDLPAQVADVIRATATNRSSMLQDVMAGRATEIDYITGYLLDVARRHNVAAPYNEALYRSILALGR
jgi:2-dehydropantoate 2-reductase